MELHNTKKGNNTITEYLQRIKEIRDKLAAVTIEVDDEELLHIILKGLLKEYNPFCSAIRTRSDALEDLELLHSESNQLNTLQRMTMIQILWQCWAQQDINLEILLM